MKSSTATPMVARKKVANTQAAHNVVKLLEHVLADTMMLYLKTQNYHWNVTGTDFISLHELFEQHYTDLAQANDDLAERIRALGHKTANQLQLIHDYSSIPEANPDCSAKEMLNDLINSHSLVCVTLKNAIKVAHDEDDPVTEGMLIERLTIHEKTLWMLRASL